MSKISKTVPVRAKIIKASTRTIETFFCDVEGCDQKAATYTRSDKHVSCDLCNRDICQKHLYYDDRYSDDYPSRLCVYCWNIWIPIRQEMSDRHDKEEERLKRKAIKESLAHE